MLGIPDHITQAALLPVAYYTGDDFKPAKRVPARERTYWNGWDNPTVTEIPRVGYWTLEEWDRSEP